MDKAHPQGPIEFDLTPDEYRIEWNTGAPSIIRARGPELPRLDLDRPSMREDAKFILEFKAESSGCEERLPVNRFTNLYMHNMLPGRDFRNCVLDSASHDQIVVRYLFFVEGNVVRAVGQLQREFDPTLIWGPPPPDVGPPAMAPRRPLPIDTESQEYRDALQLLRKHNEQRRAPGLSRDSK